MHAWRERKRIHDSKKKKYCNLVAGIRTQVVSDSTCLKSIQLLLCTLELLDNGTESSSVKQNKYYS